MKYFLDNLDKDKEVMFYYDNGRISNNKKDITLSKKRMVVFI